MDHAKSLFTCCRLLHIHKGLSHHYSLFCHWLLHIHEDSCVAIVCLVVGCCIFTKWSHCIASLFYFRLLHIYEGLSCCCSLFCCRLLHIHEGSSRRCREIVQLLDITSVDQCQERSLTLKQRKALRITAKGICLGIY